MTRPKANTDWQIEQRRQELAGKLADDIVARLELSTPIDPFKVIASEAPILKAGGRDFGDAFDGKLKFHRGKHKFLLFFNTKYDIGLPPGSYHPRTRFSISHELGHYFIDAHHKYLRRGGKPHPSSSEFRSDIQMEREADAFAASLLLPTQRLKPIVNKGELSPAVVDNVARDFHTSLVSTTIRSVRLSDFPCAVAGIRGGQIEWMFPSDQLIKGGCYPGKKTIESPSAKERWEAYLAGVTDRCTVDGMARLWFQMFDREEDLYDIYVTEHYFPAPTMGTLVVLLTIDEGDLFADEEDEANGDGD